MEKEDTGDYHTYDEVATTSLGADQVLPVLHKWASIFPGKLPDNPYKDSSSGNFTYRHYLYSRDNNNTVPKSFNSNKYGPIKLPPREYETQERFPLVLTGDIEKYTPEAATGLSTTMSGKARNIAPISIPKDMQIPYIVGDVEKAPLYKIDAPNEGLYFSTYYFTNNLVRNNAGPRDAYMLVGWGEGQQFLTANAYKFDMDNQKLHIYSRYLGPAYHRPYYGGWSTLYSWDVSWYIWKTDRPTRKLLYIPEVDDTQRELTLGGYKYDGVRETNVNSDHGSSNSLFYWIHSAGSTPRWLYFYGESISGNRGPQGVGAVANAKGEAYSTADQSKLKAYIRLFSKKPIAN